jgi:hypothetical protein
LLEEQEAASKWRQYGDVIRGSISDIEKELSHKESELKKVVLQIPLGFKIESGLKLKYSFLF